MVEYGYTRDDVDSNVYVASHGITGGWTGQKWYTCAVCSQPFRENEMVWYEGRPYGKPCGDYLDIKSLERDKHYKVIFREGEEID